MAKDAERAKLEGRVAAVEADLAEVYKAIADTERELEELSALAVEDLDSAPLADLRHRAAKQAAAASQTEAARVALTALQRRIPKLEDSLAQARLQLRRYDGAGAVAEYEAVARIVGDKMEEFLRVVEQYIAYRDRVRSYSLKPKEYIDLYGGSNFNTGGKRYDEHLQGQLQKCRKALG